MKKHIEQKKKRGSFLFLGLLFLVFLFLLVMNVSPLSVSSLLGISISVRYIFYFLVFFTMFFFTLAIMNRFLHAFFVGIFTMTSCMFLINDLRNPLFFLLLAAVLFVIELLITSWKRKEV